MNILSVFDPEFAPYGAVLEGYDLEPLLDALRKHTPRPTDDVIYVPSDPNLEATPLYEPFRDNVYGGMPIQMGYCNGNNRRLDSIEYHRDSELNIPADDMVFLLALKSQIKDNQLDTSLVKAFSAPAGTLVQLYETTLHYAPCTAPSGDGFRVVIVLPKGTNTDKPAITIRNEEDKLLTARNKWLINLGNGAISL